MSMTDIMSHMKLSAFPQIALPIFLVAFAAICIYAFTRSRREIDHAARLPIDDQPQAVKRSSGVNHE
ncbi:MAG: CcoQ/FixQ family Cbb3-type cytochrome c oxidase assembly chaperone [Phycisphaerae bacterium]